MKKLLLIFMAVVICGSLLSQNITVSGRVLDQSSDKPLIYANIWFKNINKGTYTNDDGYFKSMFKN